MDRAVKLSQFSSNTSEVYNGTQSKSVENSSLGGGLSSIDNTSIQNIRNNISKVYETLGHKFSSIQGANGNILPNIDIKDAGSDTLYIEAELLLEMLAKQTLSVTMLSPQQKISILLYFYKYNKKIGRIIDLFVNIPLSGMELKYPDTVDNQIVKDYIKDFFNNMWNDLNFKEVLTKAYRDRKLFGFGAILVSDDYSYSTMVANKLTGNVRKETMLDFNNIKESMTSVAKDLVQSGSDLEEIESITKKYKQHKNSITLESKKSVIFRYFPDMQGDDLIKLKQDEQWFEKYVGIKFIKNLDPYISLNRDSNTDINYYKYNLPTDQNLIKTFGGIQDENTITTIAQYLQNLGYSKSYLSLFTSDKKTVSLDSYGFSSTDCWVASFENGNAYSTKDKSILNRVFSQAIDIEVVAKANRSKSNRAYKNTTIYNTEAKGDDFTLIEGLIHQANSREGSTYIVTNKSVTASDISMDARQTVDLDSIGLKAEEDLISGLGMTDSLVGGADSYANSYLKLELLTSEFIQERLDFAQFLEEQVFKPVAIKKGLFIRDTWGKIIPVYPKVTFGRISLARNSEDFSLLLSMASEGKLPYTYILKALNFDVEEMKTLLENEQSTIFNTQIKEFLSSKILENEKFGNLVLQDKNHIAKILNEMNIEISDKELEAFVDSLNDKVLTDEDVEDLVEKYNEEHPEDEVGKFSTGKQNDNTSNKILKAKDILEAIGGNQKLKDSVGAYNIVENDTKLSFCFKSSAEANSVKIEIISKNKYRVSLARITKDKTETKYSQVIKDLDNFKSIFKNVTGLYLPKYIK